MTTSAGDIVDDPDGSRFLLVSEGSEAELVYRKVGKRLILVHTGVPEELGGRGIGGRLVAAAVDEARREGLTVVPQCPFARRWLEQHPDAVAGVTVDY